MTFIGRIPGILASTSIILLFPVFLDVDRRGAHWPPFPASRLIVCIQSSELSKAVVTVIVITVSGGGKKDDDAVGYGPVYEVGNRTV